jgi:hypothetical protein
MKKYYLYISLLILVFACREKYVPKLDLPASSFLVVEGYINSGTGPTTITLSRTTKLSDTAMILYETKAVVRIEGKTNTTPIPLTETTKGVYTRSQLTLNPADQYRLYIKTANGKEYVSTYSTVRSTPPIDSISWVKNTDGLQIYANTHDPSGNTRYYQFFYNETWEFRMPYTSSLKLGYLPPSPPIFPNPRKFVAYLDSATWSYDSTIFKCWKTNALKGIEIISTEQLSQDVVSLKPLVFIENGSWKLSQLYTIHVRQRALSKEAYNFFEQVRKNTEQLGSIFDAQPSDNNGNIRCITNAEELAIGFIEVTQEREQRIWISQAQLGGWRWNRNCAAEISVVNQDDSLDVVTTGQMMLTNPDIILQPSGRIARAFAAAVECVDCRKLGTNVKPPFWP